MAPPLRLTTLGGLALVAEGRPLGGAVGQRRPLAVLALLAAAGDGGVSRDKLVAVLWPDAEPERGRRTLTQTLYSIRRAAGVDGLFAGVGDVRLDPDAVASDLGELDAALRAGRLADAAALYRGPFLDGFHVPGADEFERWAEGERRRLAQRHADTLRTLARQADSAGDQAAAVAWHRRLVAHDPLDSAATLGLVEALGRAGDAAGAERAVRIHASLLHDELGLAPAPALRARVEAIRAAQQGERGGTPVEVAASGVTSNGASDTASGMASGTASDVAAGDAPGGPPRETDTDDPPPAPTHSDADRRIPARPELRPLSRPLVRARRLARAAALAAAAVALVALGVAIGRAGDSAATTPAAPVRATVVAVLPFAVDAADPALAYLGAGTADLLTGMLGGAGGPRAVDPRAVRAALEREGAVAPGPDADRARARRVAAAVGAGEALVGRVGGTAGRLVVRAALLDAATGAERASAESGGPPDSLAAIVDALAVRLLAGRELYRDRIAAYTATPLPALRAFLRAESAFRAARYQEAVALYERALEGDSAFAPAALGLALAADRFNAAEQHDRGLALAWMARDGFGERDRAYLLALAGPRYPEPSPAGEQLAAWERAVSLAPDRASAWSELGERFFYDGATLGIRNAPQRAAAAFRRALALDPDDVSALRHEVELAARAADTARLTALATPERLRRAGPLAGYLAWRVAVALGDEAALARLRERVPSLGEPSLRAIAMVAQHDAAAGGLADGERVLRFLGARAALATEQLDVLLAQHSLALNRGRPVLALDVTEQIQDVRPGIRAHLRLRVLDALYAEGDSAAAAAAAAELARTADAPAAGSEGERAARLADACVLAQWRVMRLAGVPAELAAARRAVAALRGGGVPRVPVPVGAAPHACAALVDAMLAVAAGAGDARAQVERLDALTLTGPALNDASTYAPVAMARLFERLGDRARALGAVRQRPYLRGWPRYLSTALREEGRLALALGDSAGALRAHERYLALRGEPEAPVRPAVDAARATAARLRAALR